MDFRDKWKEVYGSAEKCESDSEGDNKVQSPPEKRRKISRTTWMSRFRLENILNDTSNGKKLCEIYVKNEKFVQAQRKVLVDEIVQYVTEKDIQLSVQAMDVLADEIVERFPTEKKVRNAKKMKFFLHNFKVK